MDSSIVPPEIITEVYSHLKFNRVYNLRCLCRFWRDHCLSPEYWSFYLKGYTQYKYGKLLIKVCKSNKVWLLQALFTMGTQVESKAKFIIENIIIHRGQFKAFCHQKNEMIQFLKKYGETRKFDPEQKNITRLGEAVKECNFNKITELSKDLHYTDRINCLIKLKRVECYHNVYKIMFTDCPLDDKEIILRLLCSKNLELLKFLDTTGFLDWSNVKPINCFISKSKEVVEYGIKKLNLIMIPDNLEIGNKIHKEYIFRMYFNKLIKGTDDDRDTLWNSISTSIGFFDYDAYLSMLLEFHEKYPNPEEIRYIYRSCEEEGHDYLAEKLKPLLDTP